MKLRTSLFLLANLVFFAARSQQLWLYDNTNYKAIYFKEACDLIAKHPDLVLLDVRTAGEYADTSRFIGSRIGSLKGAINISSDLVQKRYAELLPYKDRTILVYCSHSFRSRRISKMLADSGFTKVYSLNGGMTEVDREPDAAFPCKTSLYTTKTPYKLMGPEDAAAFMRDPNNIVIDTRPPSQFNGTDASEGLNIGRIKGAINVPQADFDHGIKDLEKYKKRRILVCDLYTSNAMEAATKLKNAGFTDVAVLFDGLDFFLLHFPSSSKERKELTIATPAYHLTGVREAVDLIDHSPEVVVADMRTKEEFGNSAKLTFLNLGHIKNAINFTEGSQLEDFLKDKPKNTPVLVYRSSSAAPQQMMGGMTMPAVIDVAAVCKKLTAEGYMNVHLLYDGISNVVWASANVEGEKDAKGILTDHQGLY